MESRYQWRPLTAGSNVAAAQVSDDVNPRQFSEQSRIVSLAREPKFRPVADGLSMRDDGLDGAARRRSELCHAGGVACGDRIRGQGFAHDFIGAGSLQRHQAVTQLRAEGNEGGREGGDLIVAEIGQHAVDAVHAGAGHQTDEEG